MRLRSLYFKKPYLDTKEGLFDNIVNNLDIEKGRVGISTKELESQPGDILKDSILVYQNAEVMAEKYQLDNNL